MSLPTSALARRRASRTLLVLLVALLGAVVLPASPASAHAELLRSTPEDGATLKAAPASVTLIFGEEILADGLGMVATAADGSKVALGKPAVSGTKVVAAWPPDAPGGSYKVAWRVVSADGHPISGVLSFSYAGAASPSASPTPTSSPTSPSASASSPAATASPTDVVSPAASPASSSGSSGSTSWPLIIGVAALLAAVIALVVVVARRRSDAAGGDRT